MCVRPRRSTSSCFPLWGELSYLKSLSAWPYLYPGLEKVEVTRTGILGKSFSAHGHDWRLALKHCRLVTRPLSNSDAGKESCKQGERQGAKPRCIVHHHKQILRNAMVTGSRTNSPWFRSTEMHKDSRLMVWIIQTKTFSIVESGRNRRREKMVALTG